jgi:hypothetical protein
VGVGECRSAVSARPYRRHPDDRRQVTKQRRTTVSRRTARLRSGERWQESRP